MEFLKDLLTPKCFSILAYIMSILHLFSGVTFSAITGKIRSGEKRKFSCNVGTKADKTYVEAACYSKYDEIYNSPLPFYGFVIFSFGAVLVVYLVYSISVKSRVEEVETSTDSTADRQAQDDHETENEGAERSRRVCYSYVFHLVVRFFLGILFTVLQYKVLYPLGFDSEFTCVLEAETKSTEATNVTAQPFNSTATNCHCPTGSEKAFWSTFVAVLNNIFASIALGEAIYLVRRVWKSRRDGMQFEFDSEFCNVYLLRKRQNPNPSVQIPLITIQPSLCVFDVHKRQILNDSQRTEIQCGPNLHVSLNDMYVDLIVYSGRAEHKFTKNMKRHEMYHVYLKPPQDSIRIHSIKDLFNSNEDTERRTPRTILVVGRPGIGKTSLCRKIMHDWATPEADDFFSGKILLLLKFRWFNSDKYREMNLKELLRCGTQVDDITFEDIFQQLSADPTKAIIIFDGLDESKEDEASCFTDEERAPNDCTTKMTVLALFIKLVLGKLLEGATVLTTTRPAADHFYSRLGFNRNVEILGFTQDKIEEYVQKFCKINERTDTNNKLWNHIKATPELLNLCYIPVNCYIVCAVLFQDIKNLANDTMPKTLTELYKKALTYFSNKHGKSDPCVNTNDLDKLAFLGVKERKLTFEESEVNEHMKNSGFFNSLPNAYPGDEVQYCFIHLTIQEFLAARHIVETIGPGEMPELFWDGKWHLVIQFVAGLIGYKMKFIQIDVYSKFKEHVTNALVHVINTINTRKEERSKILMLKCLKELNDDDIVQEVAAQTEMENGRLNLQYFGITPTDCSAVVYFLKHVDLLRELKLDGNPLGEGGCQELGKLLQERCLQTLSVRSCEVNNLGLQSLITAAQKMSTCNLNHKHSKLIKIDVCGNEITNEGVLFLCEFLKNKNCNLTNLALGARMINDDTVTLLSNTLKDEHCNLTQLELSAVDITDDGVSFLCDALKDEHCNLTKLGLNNINITDISVSLLCNALKDKHCNLTQLELDNEGITHHSVSLLCNALKDKHCNLRRLYLPGYMDNIRLLVDNFNKNNDNNHCFIELLHVTNVKKKM